MKIILTPVAGSTPAHVRYEGGKLTHNGQAAMLADHITIEYGEESGVTTFSDDRSVVFEVIPSTWINPNPPAPVVVDDGEAALLAWRETATAERFRLKAVLGDAAWQAIAAWANGQDRLTQLAIQEAVIISRSSQMIDVLAYVLGWTEDQVDDLFRAAQAIPL